MKNESKNEKALPLLLSEWLHQNTDDYIGSDGMVNGRPAFQHDVEHGGKKYVIFITA